MGVYLYPNNTETPLKEAYIGIPNPTSIVLDKNSINLTTIGQTEQLTATLTPTICDQSITWSSDDTTVATVSTTGLVTCVTPGTATITATTSNGLTATCGVTNQSGWQPGVNTTLYLPLDGDSIDPYNNVTYTWVGTAAYTTWDTGVQAGQFNGNNAVKLGMSKDFEDGTGELTYCFWFTTSSPSTEQRCSFNVSGKYFNICRITGSKLGGYCAAQQTYTATGTTTITANTKYLATITMKENDTLKVYLNGVLEATTNISGSFTGLGFQDGQHVGAGRTGDSEFWNGMIKDFIIENKVWSAQEVADYYAQTS